MTPAAPSPFLDIPESEWLCASPLCFAIFDPYPVSPGHVLVITRRVVATYFDCTPAEQKSEEKDVGNFFNDGFALGASLQVLSNFFVGLPKNRSCSSAASIAIAAARFLGV